MKKITLLVLGLFTLVGCKNKNEETLVNDKTEYVSFGDSISDEKVITTKEMNHNFNTLKEGDTLTVKFKSKINSVCKKKGCWMTLDLGENKEVFVKFKDYGFFVPKNADNEVAIVSGKAFVSIESVNDQKHYAKDEGKAQVAIDSIISPKTTYSFIANGVLIKK
jgi:hypothetical protein